MSLRPLDCARPPYKNGAYRHDPSSAQVSVWFRTRNRFSTARSRNRKSSERDAAATWTAHVVSEAAAAGARCRDDRCHDDRRRQARGQLHGAAGNPHRPAAASARSARLREHRLGGDDGRGRRSATRLPQPNARRVRAYSRFTPPHADSTQLGRRIESCMSGSVNWLLLYILSPAQYTYAIAVSVISCVCDFLRVCGFVSVSPRCKRKTASAIKTENRHSRILYESR